MFKQSLFYLLIFSPLILAFDCKLSSQELEFYSRVHLQPQYERLNALANEMQNLTSTIEELVADLKATSTPLLQQDNSGTSSTSDDDYDVIKEVFSISKSLSIASLNK